MAKKKENKLTDETLHAEEAEATPTPTEPAKPATFKGKINKYGFLHFGRPLMEAWRLTKGTEQPVSIELTAEGALLIKKNLNSPLDE